MITEDYVSFETAKLLKEKGFDWEWSPFYSEQDRDEWRQNNNYTIPNTAYDPDLPFDSETITLIAPHISLQMAMKWLREVHNLALNVCYLLGMWSYSVYRTDVSSSGFNSEDFDTYEEACESAIRFCLENLI